jgi:hypothetical protein
MTEAPSPPSAPPGLIPGKGTDAGLSGAEQIIIALRCIAAMGGVAEIRDIYEAVEERMSERGLVLSEQGKASLRFFVNERAVDEGYVYPHDKTNRGWRLTPKGEAAAASGTAARSAVTSGTPRVFIANFGRGNYLWPTCLERSTIATSEDEDLRPFWLGGDREGYMAHCIRTKTTAAGTKPTASVASRWFNLRGTISSTEGDVWIHREKGELWWTTSLPGEADVTRKPAPHWNAPDVAVYEMHKPARPWSNKTAKGSKLHWDALHPKARPFLATEATLQQLSADNAEYALALIAGDDLRAWHGRPEWKAAEERSGRGATTVFDARRRAVMRMVQTALQTVAGANGQQVLRTMKVKEVRFQRPDLFEAYVDALVSAQEGLCALTGIPLQFDGDHTDAALVCSLDRIDSAGHYEQGNLQVVCRFVNRWKNDGEDAEFRRLIALLRSDHR